MYIKLITLSYFKLIIRSISINKYIWVTSDFELEKVDCTQEINLIRTYDNYVKDYLINYVIDYLISSANGAQGITDPLC